MIHHCTRCELRFPSESELTQHLDIDHHAAVEGLGRFRYPAQHPAEPLYTDPDVDPAPPGQAHRVLLVANQTLTGDALESCLRERLAAGPLAVTVLVPATHSADYAAPDGSYAALGKAAREPDEQGQAQAAWRLRQAVNRLAQLGVSAHGEVGSADPFAAVSAVLEARPHDEVILSTLPAGVSRWLDMDVPTRIRRHHRVPVTVVEAEGLPART